MDIYMAFLWVSRQKYLNYFFDSIMWFPLYGHLEAILLSVKKKKVKNFLKCPFTIRTFLECFVRYPMQKSFKKYFISPKFRQC